LRATGMRSSTAQAATRSLASFSSFPLLALGTRALDSTFTPVSVIIRRSDTVAKGRERDPHAPSFRTRDRLKPAASRLRPIPGDGLSGHLLLPPIPIRLAVQFPGQLPPLKRCPLRTEQCVTTTDIPLRLSFRSQSARTLNGSWSCLLSRFQARPMPPPSMASGAARTWIRFPFPPRTAGGRAHSDPVRPFAGSPQPRSPCCPTVATLISITPAVVR